MMIHKDSWKILLVIIALLMISSAVSNYTAGINGNYRYFTVKIVGNGIVVVKPLLKADQIGNVYLLEGGPSEIPSMNSVAMEYLKIIKDLGLGKPKDYVVGERLESSGIVLRLGEVGLKTYGIVYYEKGVSLLVYNDSTMPKDADKLRNILGIRNKDDLIVVRYSLLTSNYPKHSIEDRIRENTPRLEKLGLYQVSYIYDVPALYFNKEYLTENNLSNADIINTVKELITNEQPLIVVITSPDNDEGLEDNLYRTRNSVRTTNNNTYLQSSNETTSTTGQYTGANKTSTIEDSTNKTKNTNDKPRNNPSSIQYLSIPILTLIGILAILYKIRH